MRAALAGLPEVPPITPGSAAFGQITVHGHYRLAVFALQASALGFPYMVVGLIEN